MKTIINFLKENSYYYPSTPAELWATAGVAAACVVVAIVL